MERAHKRHRAVWNFLQATLRGALKRFFHYECEEVRPGAAPYLVVANHNVDLDPALVGMSFREQMYFVASEHVFRKGFASWLLNYCFGPISRMKGTTDAAAALGVLRAMRGGYNVCLFAEGNRSFNGVTGPIFPATGKLAKAAGGALVTYRIEGGYLTSPRWSRSMRKGKMRGSCVNIYTREQLKDMTPEEVNAHIREDLFEDAFERQLENPARFRGRNIAEGLENALYFCPKCSRAATLHSKGDRFFCDCGFHVRFTETGFFEGEDAPFSTVRDWDAWQNGRIAAYIGALCDGEEAFFDEGMQLIGVGERHRSSELEAGRLSMSKRALSLGSHVFPLEKIANMGMIGTSKIMFSTTDGVFYELRSGSGVYCGRKYYTLYHLLKGGAQAASSK